jgi:hypothetical protein
LPSWVAELFSKVHTHCLSQVWEGQGQTKGETFSFSKRER